MSNGCVQSDRPEDTYQAREEGLSAEDFEVESQADPAPSRRCLAASDIDSANDRGHLDNWVPTPEWGGPGAGVYVLTPSGEDRERYERLTKPKAKKKGRKTVVTESMNLDQIRERLVIDFVCDEQGQKLFAFENREQHREQIKRLRRKAAAPMGRITDMIFSLMGWGENEFDDAVKNSETDRS